MSSAPFILTDVTFWSYPPGEAITQVSTYQVTTRAGVDTYARLALVGI